MCDVVELEKELKSGSEILVAHYLAKSLTCSVLHLLTISSYFNIGIGGNEREYTNEKRIVFSSVKYVGELPLK